jgi:hypothetical protein
MLFDRLDRQVSRTIDAVNAIPFCLTPMIGTPNGRPVKNSGRRPIEARGVFDYVSIEHGIELGVRKSYRESNDLRALQVGREPLLSVDRSYFPTLADEPRQGDLIDFPDRSEYPGFQVVSCQRDGLSRLTLSLVARGVQA